jgi:amino acid transporter
MKMSSDEEVLFVRKASGLVRSVGPITTAAITFGYLTQGITYYPSFTALWFPGANLPLSYLMGLPTMIMPLFVAIFFTAAMPRSASDYVAVSRICSPQLSFVGTFIQWQNWLWVGAVTCPGILTMFGPFFAVLGKMTRNEGLAAAAIPFSNYGTWELFFLGLVGLVLMTVVATVGMKWSSRALNIMFTLQLVGVVIGTSVLGYYALLGPSATAGAWNKIYGAGAWEEIVGIANKNGWQDAVKAATGSADNWGWPGGWSMAQTLPAVLPAAYAWWGMELSNQVAGEIKEPSKTYTYGIILSAAIALVWYMATTIWLMQAFGAFFLQYTYVDINFPDLMKINAPIFPYTYSFEAPLASALFNNVYVGPFQMLLQELNLASGGLAMIMVCSRITFAWSYDRVIPEAFSKVNSRFRTPHISIWFMFALSIVFFFFNNFYPYLLAANTYALSALRYMFMGWAAMIFPWKLKDIFEHGFKTKIAGIPLIAILGAITTGTSSWLVIQNVAILASDVNSLFYQIGVFALGALIFSIFYAYRKSKGIDMDALYREIPPA